MTYYIYKITNKVNGKIYIGKTKNPEKRLKQHINASKRKKTKLYNAMNKYGVNNFSIEIIDRCDDNTVNIMEIDYIKKYDTINKGYNITIGGEGGDTFTNLNEDEKEKRRLKSRRAGIEINNRSEVRQFLVENGKKLWENEEYVNKVLTNHKKAVTSDEYRKKQSEISKVFSNTPEMKKLRSENALGVKNSRWRGFAYVIESNGNIIDKYDTFKLFSDLVNLHFKIRNEFHNGKNIIKYNNNFIFISKNDYGGACEISPEMLEIMKG
jgi:group I intron endonuclease